MARLRDKSAPTAPSQFVKDLNLLVERVMLRCLQKDPGKRPTSALQVAAALPGGDPLAAALAAGETPSPEMVAASGETERLRPIVAWVLLAGVLVLVIAAAVWSGKRSSTGAFHSKSRQTRLPNEHGIFCRVSGTLSLRWTPRWGSTREKIFCDISRSTTNRKRVGTISRPERLCFGIAAARNRSRLFPFLSRAPVQGSVWTDDPPLDVSRDDAG